MNNKVKPGKREGAVSLVVVERACMLCRCGSRSRSRGSRREDGGWLTVTGGEVPNSSVHFVRWQCTEQGCHVRPEYLSPHLRVLICVRLTAKEEEEHRTEWTQDKSGFIRTRTQKSIRGKIRTGQQRTEQGSPAVDLLTLNLRPTESYEGQNVSMCSCIVKRFGTVLLIVVGGNVVQLVTPDTEAGSQEVGHGGWWLRYSSEESAATYTEHFITTHRDICLINRVSNSVYEKAPG